MSRILLIDDDRDFIASMRLALEANGFEVDEAPGPDEGIAQVLERAPDLVILDVMMPSGYEGFDVVRTLREEHGLRDLPILILTSLHEKRAVPYRFAPDDTYLPVDVFLDKPLGPQALVDIVNEMLGKRRVIREHPL